MLRQLVVGVDRGKRAPGDQVVLVGCVDEATTERARETTLPLLDDVEHPHRLGARVCPHVGLGGVVADAERHDADGCEARETVEHTEQRVVERVAVVDPRAHHHLAVYLDATVEERRQPAQARCAAAVPQQSGPQVRIGRVDAHVERAELLREHPFEVGLGEPRERGEVPIEKGKAIVVVLQVQAATHPLRELVDETEGAVVVARANAVEHRALEIEPEGRAGGFVDDDQLFEPAAPELELHAGLVGLDLIADDVAHRFAVEREELVAGEEPRSVGR